MINLELTPQTAIAVLDLICREEKLYGQEAVPSRIVDLRALLVDIDKGLEAHFSNLQQESES